jgi:hypothetical protein
MRITSGSEGRASEPRARARKHADVTRSACLASRMVCRRITVILRWTCAVLALAAGCGPTTYPMIDRLSEEDQKQVDTSWVNMFAPPDRLDRTLLLDVLLASQFHQRGVDRTTMVSEKEVGTDRAVMTMRFDRKNPAFDEFTIALVDDQGRERRRERYTADEIRARLHFLGQHMHAMTADPDESDSKTPRDRLKRARLDESLTQEYDARIREIQAATQPAVG